MTQQSDKGPKKITINIGKRTLKILGGFILGASVLASAIGYLVDALEFVTLRVAIGGSIFIILFSLIAGFLVRRKIIVIDGIEYPEGLENSEEESNNNGILIYQILFVLGLLTVLWVPYWINSSKPKQFSKSIPVSPLVLDQFKSKARIFAIELKEDPVDPQLNIEILDSLYPLVESAKQNSFYRTNAPFETAILFRTYASSSFLKTFAEGVPQIGLEEKELLRDGYRILDSLFRKKSEFIDDGFYNDVYDNFKLYKKASKRIEKDLSRYTRSLNKSNELERLRCLKQLVATILPISMTTAQRNEIEKRFCIIFPCDNDVMNCPQLPDCNPDTIPCSKEISSLLNRVNSNGTSLQAFLELIKTYGRGKGFEVERSIFPKCSTGNKDAKYISYIINEALGFKWEIDLSENVFSPISEETVLLEFLFSTGLTDISNINYFFELKNGVDDYELVLEKVLQLQKDKHFFDSLVPINFLIAKYPENADVRFLYTKAIFGTFLSLREEHIKIVLQLGGCDKMEQEALKCIELDPDGQFANQARQLVAMLQNERPNWCMN